MIKRNIPSPKWLDQDIKFLIEAIVKLRNTDECQRFLRDLLTIPEIKVFAARWRVANMLDQKYTYEEIEKQTGMSSTTIARINRWLEYGEGGYRLLIDRLKKRIAIR